MLRLWKKLVLMTVGATALAYDEFKKSANRRMKEARKAAQRAT